MRVDFLPLQLPLSSTPHSSPPPTPPQTKGPIVTLVNSYNDEHKSGAEGRERGNGPKESEEEVENRGVGGGERGNDEIIYHIIAGGMSHEGGSKEGG